MYLQMRREVSPNMVWPFFVWRMFLFHPDGQIQNRHVVQLESFFFFLRLTYRMSHYYESYPDLFSPSNSYLTDANPKTFFQKVIALFSKYQMEFLF